MFYQLKQCDIITYRLGIYELPHELPDDIRLSCEIIKTACLSFVYTFLKKFIYKIRTNMNNSKFL